MREKAARTRTKKSEALGKSPQTAICSSSLEISPNSQANLKQRTEQQSGDISVEKPKFEVNIPKESAKSLVIKSDNDNHSHSQLDLQKLKSLKRKRRLTPCLELLEKQGLRGETAIFILSQINEIWEGAR
jgi:hypothetical protein